MVRFILGRVRRLLVRIGQVAVIPLARILQIFPGSLRRFGIARDVKSYHRFDPVILFPEKTIRRRRPKSIYPVDHSAFDAQMIHSFREEFTLTLNNGVSCYSGANCTVSGIVIPEVSEGFVATRKLPILNEPQLLPKYYDYDGAIATLTSMGQTGYFHWIFDVLPRLHLLELSGQKPERLYIEYKTRFQTESLELLGYKREKIINAAEFPFLQATRLVIPSLPSHNGNMPDWACRFLRRSFLQQKTLGITSDVNTLPKRIYVSRSDAQRRRILNEPQLIQRLEQYGFIIVKPEHFSLMDQVCLFQNLDAIVAPHGAGLSNLVFCNPGTKVIEIFPPSHVNVCFWTLCEQVNLDYYYIMGLGPKSPHFYEPRHVTKDIEVNLDELEATLVLAGIA